ncbi:serine/arginine-rich splicing factor 11-like isoform X4 [Gymnodraco acuticeps]|nr:serine/arginine-rich splicing factor 11-like isoform X3 [Pseudochaenichthys georgianus]XP_034090553.1 serine/arginine-rich splicing factor 11-like isoform X4 [Gymnodraco acuticeps]
MSNPAMGGNPFGVPNMDAMAAFGFPGHNMNPQAADQLLKFMTDPKLNPLAAGLNLSASLKADASNKEMEEAMKRVREAQSLISAAIEPGNKESKKKRSRSRSRSRRRRSRSRSKHRRTRSKSQRRRSNSRSRKRSKSPRRRHTDSRDQSKRSPSRSRDRKKDDSGKRRSKTPPKSYSTTRRSRSEERRRRKSRSKSRSPPKKKTPSPRRHKKEKKKEKERERKIDKERNREERERSTSKKKKSKDKERDRERKSDGEKGDVKITRDYDEEEQGYDSGKERADRKDSDDSALSPQSVEGNGTARQAKVNGADDHHEEDMDVSD